MGEFWRQFFPKKSVDCECRELLQTREHIIRSCNHYETQRTKLVTEHSEITLQELLGTPRGIAALSEFIRGSGAFTFTRGKFTP